MRLAVTHGASRGHARASRLRDWDARLVKHEDVWIVEVETGPADALAVVATVRAWLEGDHVDDVVVEIDRENYTLDSGRSMRAET